MFSTTTMASSTTKPTDMVSAISDRLSRLKLSRYIIANEPSSASGTVMPGMSVAQKLRRKSNMTSTTSTMVSIRVNSTSSTEARIVLVRSCRIETSMAGGNVPGQPRQLRLDLFDGLNDVSARLLIHNQQ